MKDIINCHKLREEWYEKAIAMACGTQPWENGFNWPDDPQDPMNIPKWRGCVRELHNTIDMIETRRAYEEQTHG